ncbi:MAG TPA: preprotein translocase subunit YajC [bacterium]|nr:preprotein translocase subunit YajC [bacterium]HQG45262.1 preprotein translocase subunit YajC [bacterium]HQI50355.1 preprotein translocase subunit YajC [bacterium]HQJ65559.1 preprotein translocase subunit YajC [bacterium]
MNALLLVLASAAPTAGGQQGSSGAFGFFLPIILIFVIMYFLMFRPQAKKQKEMARMIDALQKGDRVITIGGIYGVVQGIKEKENVIVLKIADNVKIEVAKTAVARKLAETENAAQ